MAEASKTKKLLEVAKAAAAVAPGHAEAQGAIATWQRVCDDPEASQSLKSIATARRRELEAADVRGDTQAREAALLALAAIAQSFP